MPLDIGGGSGGYVIPQAEIYFIPAEDMDVGTTSDSFSSGGITQFKVETASAVRKKIGFMWGIYDPELLKVLFGELL